MSRGESEIAVFPVHPHRVGNVDIRQSKLNQDPCLESVLFKGTACDKWELSTTRKGMWRGRV